MQQRSDALGRAAVGNGVGGKVDIDLVDLDRIERFNEEVTRRRTGRRSLDEVIVLIYFADVPTRSFVYATVKRAVDIVVSSVLLVITAPVMGLLALLIRLDSRGGAIFRQQRVGRDGRMFTFYKFRTMYADARERFPDLYAYDYTDDEIASMYFKIAYDPRCTRVGRRLRRTSLDELPNLWNVFRGDMTLVGPRPEIPEMLPYYRDDQYCKFRVKPGLTGLAQVSGRNILRFVETNAKDMEYVHTRSLRLDAKILIRTVKAVAGMIGAH